MISSTPSEESGRHTCTIENKHLNSIDIIKSELYQHGYRFVKFLGQGGYAKVVLAEIMPGKLARYKADADSTGNACVLSVAIKVINKLKVSKDFLDKCLPRELENHWKLQSHQHVVRIYETMQTRENAYIVMDYCPNGDLVDLINRHVRGDERGIGEPKSKKLFKQLCEAVHHMHSAYIVHRDLKCENILLDKDHNIQLTDFGFSERCNESNQMLKTRCGTFSFTAPEVMTADSYNGFQSDIWSLGVTLFAMVNGRLPYNHSQLSAMDEDMKLQRLKFRPNISSDCIELIKKMLQFAPNHRPSIREVLEDPWLNGSKPARRQLNRPKWEQTQCSLKVPEASPNVTATSKAGRTADRKAHSLSKKCAASTKPRTVNGTVLINRNAGETVTLKSPLHGKNSKTPNKMSVTQKPSTTARPQQTDRKGQKAKSTKTRQNVAPNKVVQAIVERKLQLEDVRLANGARRTQKEQIPFWLIKEVLEKDKHYNKNTTRPEENRAVPKQSKTSRVGFTSQRKNLHQVSTVPKNVCTVPKPPEVYPSFQVKQQQRVHPPSLKQGAHPLPAKSKVPHPPHKGSAQHPLVKTNVPYQLPKLGVPHPLAKSNVPYQPPKPCVQQTSSKPCPPAISKPAVQQQRRRLIFLKEAEKRSIVKI
ncbi:testis-specific serine/threonine-protein kinase 5-like [Ostrea edulis]|uniref:testis-specific serine/threonine-protein kinase 5-like n=1 Tax=Ostrea edulis TaxID=37623 RepID=UPI0024AFB066|nr:testis-specific serine/threonine-protein kinase 5-like [Ostrea edulis]